MCGICGFIDFNNNLNKQNLIAMTNTLSHRGPDNSDYFFDSSDSFSIGFGHRRLSIIDVSDKASQPMFFENNVIVYNGEIYNYKEIKKELEDCGYFFKSSSDTEVVLKSFHKWGKSCVNRFKGMFAFCIFNINNNKIYLFRDRFGVKPLYYYWNNGLFLFSSELKAFQKIPCFKKKLNINSIEMFLRFGYIMQPHTIFENTFKLKGGHCLKFNLLNKNLSKLQYWDIYTLLHKNKIYNNYNETLELLQKQIVSSFKYRTISDVPIGIFLSGGIDSSLVAAILSANSSQKIKTFTIGFSENNFDESKYAKKIANYIDSEHNEFLCSQKEALSLINKIPDYYDEPFGDSSAIPTMLLSKLTSEHVKVALSGDGGDELFFGYNKYFRILETQKYLKKIPAFLNKSLVFNENILKNTELRRKYFNIKSNIKYKNNATKLLEYRSSRFTDKELEEILNFKINRLYSDFDKKYSLDFNKNLQITDINTYMIDDILVKTDRASMAYSLEVREPFLDPEIAEFGLNMPNEFKFDNYNGKLILKDILKKYIPEELFNRPKMGFGIPLAKWLRDELRETLDYYTSKEKIDDKIFNFEIINKIKSDFYKGKNTEFEKLWFILMFQMWYEKWG